MVARRPILLLVRTIDRARSMTKRVWPLTTMRDGADEAGASSLTAELDSAFRLASEAGKGNDAGTRAIGLLGQVAHAADALGIISANDRLDEISTPALRVLLIPSLQSYLENESTIPQDQDRMRARKAHVEASIGAARLFFQVLRRYDVLPPGVRALLLPYMQSDGSGAVVRSPAERRMIKIQSFKLERAVQQQLDAFRQAYRTQRRAASSGPSDVFFDLLFVPGIAEDEDESESDDAWTSGELPPVHTLRTYLRGLCVLHALRSASLLESALQERELLEHVPPPAPLAASGDDTWRLDSRWFSQASGPLLSETGKPLRPFVITPSADKRAQMQAAVFRPSHRLPTMSIDEYLAEEERRGNIVRSRGNDDPTPREQRTITSEMDGTREADEAEEEARQEAIYWDAYKEQHRRGEGNTMNRG